MCVLPNKFLLKSIVFTVCEHEYLNRPPPPQLSFIRRQCRDGLQGGMIWRIEISHQA